MQNKKGGAMIEGCLKSSDGNHIFKWYSPPHDVCQYCGEIHPNAGTKSERAMTTDVWVITLRNKRSGGYMGLSADSYNEAVKIGRTHMKHYYVYVERSPVMGNMVMMSIQQAFKTGELLNPIDYWMELRYTLYRFKLWKKPYWVR